MSFFVLGNKGAIYLHFSKKIKIIPRLSSEFKRAQIVTPTDNFQKGCPSKASIRIPIRSAGASHPSLRAHLEGAALVVPVRERLEHGLLLPLECSAGRGSTFAITRIYSGRIVPKRMASLPVSRHLFRV